MSDDLKTVYTCKHMLHECYGTFFETGVEAEGEFGGVAVPLVCGKQAAARISALEAQVKEAALQGLADLGQLQEAHDAQEAAEAKLATAVEALERINDGYGPNHLSGFAHTVARVTLAEIEGDGE